MKYLDELQRLNLPKDKYVLFGSAPLAVRNLRSINDLDILVKPDLWNQLIEKYPVKKNQPNCIQIGDIEIWKDWLDLTPELDEIIDNAEIIDGFPFVTLDYVLRWKKSMNRDKDKKDVQIIEDYLKVKYG